MPAPQKRAKLQAGLLAAKAASADAAPELTRTEPVPPKAKRGTPLKPDDVFYGKGDATASSFRPWYWSYEREGQEAPSPQAGTVAPSATPPSADAKILQQRLAEAAAQSLSAPEAAPAAASPAPDNADMARPAPPAEAATAPEPAPPESRAPEEPPAEAATAPEPAPHESRAPEEPPAEAASSTDVPPPSQGLAMPENRAEAEHGRPAAEPQSAPPAVQASETDAAPPAPRVERPAEVRPERPHQRARRALRGQVEAAAPPPEAPPPEAPPLVAEDRAMAPAVIDSAPAAPVPAEPAAVASTPALAEPAEVAVETLATTIEAEMSRRRAARGQPAPAAEPHRGDRYQNITGSSLLAELAAAREARTGLPAPKASRESNLAASRVSRPLLDRVMTYGGIALIVVIAFLALSPATQYAPVARLTHLFN